MLGRIVRPGDFQQLLATAPMARSAHFVAHHVAGRPGLRAKAESAPARAELSTGDPSGCTQPVDDSSHAVPEGCWLGIAVPKRHARDAATRNLIRRQIRAVVSASEPTLARGLWLVRLRAPFDRRHFRSATSQPLRLAARAELATLMQRARAA
ncbi:MAG: ribonuclease P protein component [Burkholderiaceae bacterium]